jgi:hypothetical protein
MSDDKPSRDTPSSSSVPPELRPFMGQREWPAAERRDEAEVEAAFAPIEAMVAEMQREADREDAQRGVGNVSAYARVEVPSADKPGVVKPEPKVALVLADVPRVLPAGNPNLPTEEVSTRAFQRARATAGEERAPAKPERTVGGNTEKLRVVAAPAPEKGTPASPWAKDPGATVVRSSALPSSLRPQAATVHEDDAPGSVTPARSASDGRGRTAGIIVASAIGLAAAVFGVRAITTPSPNDRTTRSATTSASATPTVTATASAAPTDAPPAPSASTSPVASEQAPTPRAATAHPIAPAPRPSSRRSDDPYDAAPPQAKTSPAPMLTVAPTAPAPPPPQPTAVPAPPPSQKPVAPPTTSGSLVKGSPEY